MNVRSLRRTQLAQHNNHGSRLAICVLWMIIPKTCTPPAATWLPDSFVHELYIFLYKQNIFFIRGITLYQLKSHIFVDINGWVYI